MRVFALFVVCVIATLCVKGAELPPTDVIQTELLNRSVQQMARQIRANDTVTLNITQHPDAEYVEQTIFQALNGSGVTILTRNAQTEVDVVIQDMATRYTLTESDSVVREVVVTLSAAVRRNGIVTPLTIDPQRRTDVCLRHEAKAAESMQRSSTHGEIPPEARTFWDDVLEPAIFIAAAATTVVLLFTVRSK